MIKFFRKIRQSLLASGNTGKPAFAAGRYLKYAVGEIILVVIGILIALSINNWNQERLSKQKAYAYLEQINKDLSLDLKYYDYLSFRFSEDLQIYDNAIKSSTISDSALLDVGRIIIINYDSREFGPSYKSFVNSGDIELITDKDLLQKLQMYYYVRTKSLNDKSTYQNTFNIHNIEGPLVQKLDMTEDGNFSIESLRKELDSGNLMSLINWQNNFYKVGLEDIESCQKEARELQQIINNLKF